MSGTARKRRSGTQFVTAGLIASCLACGGAETPSPAEVVEEMADVVTEATGGDRPAEMPAKRQVETVRVMERVEDLADGSWTESVREYVRPDRVREHVTVVSGAEPTVTTRVVIGDTTYVRIGGRWISSPGGEDGAEAVESTLRLLTDPERRGDDLKGRAALQSEQPTEVLDGIEMRVFVRDGVDIVFPGGVVQGSERTWIGAGDLLLYRIVREGESRAGRFRSTTTYAYDDEISIETPGV